MGGFTLKNCNPKADAEANLELFTILKDKRKMRAGGHSTGSAVPRLGPGVDAKTTAPSGRGAGGADFPEAGRPQLCRLTSREQPVIAIVIV